MYFILLNCTLKNSKDDKCCCVFDHTFKNWFLYANVVFQVINYQFMFQQFCIFQLVSAENNHYSLDHISSLFTSQVVQVALCLSHKYRKELLANSTI